MCTASLGKYIVRGIRRLELVIRCEHCMVDSMVEINQKYAFCVELILIN